MFKKRQKLGTEKSVVHSLNINELEDIKLKHSTQVLCSAESLKSINELLQFMTSLDYIKEMILDTNRQFQMLESVAASSQEVNATTEDISNYVQDSNKTMNTTIKETNESVATINTTFQAIDNSIEKTFAVKNTMDEVILETEKINHIVNVIKEVADQTNLLALNASIEAARAGDSGKGFAVVAQEIKKLANNTREQVGSIQSIVNGLNGNITKTSKEIDSVIESFKLSKGSMDEALGKINKVGIAIESIGENFTEISANIEEQTAATEEMTSNLMVINEQSSKIQKETNRTGQAFFDISQKVDDIRIKLLKNAENLENDVMIELTKTDHLMWKWKVYNMILGYVKLDSETVGDHNMCRLGKWLKTLDNSRKEISDILKTMEKPHSTIHDLAKKAIIAYNNNNITSAEKILVEVEDNSRQVVQCLDKLGAVI